MVKGSNSPLDEVGFDKLQPTTWFMFYEQSFMGTQPRTFITYRLCCLPTARAEVSGSDRNHVTLPRKSSMTPGLDFQSGYTKGRQNWQLSKEGSTPGPSHGSHMVAEGRGGLTDDCQVSSWHRPSPDTLTYMRGTPRADTYLTILNMLLLAHLRNI